MQKQLGRHRPGRYRIDGDSAPAHLLGKHLRQRFHRGFAGNVHRITRQVQADGAAGEIDDPPTVVQACGGFAQGVEGATGVDVESLLEQLVAVLCQWQHLENPGVVHQHIDLAELGLSLVEHPPYIFGIGYISLDRYGLMAGLTQFHHQFRSFAGAAGVVDGDGETFAGQLSGDDRANAAGGAGDEGNFRSLVSHGGVPVMGCEANFTCLLGSINAPELP
ncbi:hypothetical protein D3C86_1016210 [compost metagenome]